MKIDHTKHTLDEIKAALLEKLKEVTPDECTVYTITVTSGGIDSSCVTVGSEWVKQSGETHYNLRGQRV